MAADVIQFPQPVWSTARVVCKSCRYLWVAVFEGSDDPEDELECPECGAYQSTMVWTRDDVDEVVEHSEDS